MIRVRWFMIANRFGLVVDFFYQNIEEYELFFVVLHCKLNIYVYTI